MRASGKAYLCLVLLMLVVMSLLFMMSVFKFQTTLTHLVQSRLTVVGESIADSLEGAVDLGLTLYELRTADALITRAKENDPGIEAIDIFDPAGQILYSTAPGRAGDVIPAQVLDVQDQAEGRTWGLDDKAAFSSGVTLTDSIGQTIGGVLFTYSKAGFAAKVAVLTESLVGNIAVIGVVFAGLAFFGIRLGFRDLDRYMGRIDEAMKAFSDAAVDADPGPTVAAPEDALPDPEVLERKLRAVAHQLARARGDIGALDRDVAEPGGGSR